MSAPDASLAKSADSIKSVDDAQTALDRLNSELNHAERLATLGTLAAGVAHEINNILTPVLAYAQLAAANPDDKAMQAKALEKTIFGVETATHIAGSILGFAGQDDAADADVDVIVRNALNCIARDPNKDHADLRIDVQPGTYVRMNPLNLQQVLMNLIINAQNALREHGRPGRISIAALTRADGTIGIRIADNGPGIPKDIAGRIFEPFVTSRRSTTKSVDSASGAVGGNGLGLAICRRLVEQVGGSITASSTPGQGTTFLIVLPSPKSIRAKAG